MLRPWDTTAVETKLININVNIDKEYQFEILKKYINFIYPLLKQQCKNWKFYIKEQQNSLLISKH